MNRTVLEALAHRRLHESVLVDPRQALELRRGDVRSQVVGRAGLVDDLHLGPRQGRFDHPADLFEVGGHARDSRRRARSPIAIALALVVAVLLASGCGGDDEGASEEGRTAETAAPAEVEPRTLGVSLEQASREFLARGDTLVKQSLDRQLLGDTVITVKPGTGECRPGAATTAVGDAERYPFACIVEANANAEGIATEVILGFVITEVDGACWTAQNERIAAAGYAPVLYPRDQALSAANRVEGCVA